MSIPATVGNSLALVLVLEDGNDAMYPQAEIYAAGSGTPAATVDLSHLAKGRYEATWTPSSVGTYTAQFFIYVDVGHLTENIVYSREAEQIFVSQSGVDDLAASLVRLLGLHKENTFIDNTDFDTNGQLLEARVRLFDSKANAEAAQDGDNYSTGLVATYTMKTAYEAVGRMQQFRMVRDS